MLRNGDAVKVPFQPSNLRGKTSNNRTFAVPWRRRCIMNTKKHAAQWLTPYAAFHAGPAIWRLHSSVGRLAYYFKLIVLPWHLQLSTLLQSSCGYMLATLRDLGVGGLYDICWRRDFDVHFQLSSRYVAKDNTEFKDPFICYHEISCLSFLRTGDLDLWPLDTELTLWPWPFALKLLSLMTLCALNFMKGRINRGVA